MPVAQQVGKLCKYAGILRDHVVRAGPGSLQVLWCKGHVDPTELQGVAWRLAYGNQVVDGYAKMGARLHPGPPPDLAREILRVLAEGRAIAGMIGTLWQEWVGAA